MSVAAQVPFRTPMYDSSGNMTVPWILFFNSLAASGVNPTPGGSGTTGLNLVADGDSLTVGYPVSASGPEAYPGQLATRVGSFVTNLGENGARSAMLISSHLSEAEALVNAALKNVYFLEIGRNDLAGSIAVGTLEANVTTIVAAMQTAGYKVIVLTITPSNGAGQPGGFTADRAAYNNWLLAGSSGADAVCDAGNDPEIQDTTNATYYQADQVHMTEAGYGVVARDAAATLQNLIGSLFSYQAAYPPSGLIFQGSKAVNANIKTAESLSVYDFGAVSSYSAAANTAAILRAIAAAVPLGYAVRFPESVYNVQKFNLLTYNALTLQAPITLYSDCVDKNSNGHGTRLICDGNGASWLKGVINCVAPNIGNTGADWSKELHGLQIKGLYFDQGAGLGAGSIDGIWLGHVWDAVIEDCGVIAPPGGSSWRAGIETWACTAGVINRFRALKCATGIALNGGAADTQPGASSAMLVLQPDVENCTSAGLSFQFSQFCKVIGGYYVSNAVGVACNGPSNSVEKGYFTGNTADVSMVTATAPYGGSVAPHQQRFFDNYFTSSVSVAGSTGTYLGYNTFGGGSSLAIDASSLQTVLDQHNSFPSAAFTDAGTLTYLISSILVTSTPVGGPGGQGQWAYDTVHSILYLCTKGGVSGTAVWTAMSSGSGVTSLNALTGALSIGAGTGISVGAAGSTVTVTNSAPYTAPAAWTTYTPSVVNGGGGGATLALTDISSFWLQRGKIVFVRIHCTVAVSVSTTPNLRFSLPTAPKASGGNGDQTLACNVLDNTSVAVLPSFLVIGADNLAGVAPQTGSFATHTYEFWLEGVYESA